MRWVVRYVGIGAVLLACSVTASHGQDAAKALSGLYRSQEFPGFFMQWFGPPDETLVTFFRQTALPE